MQRFGLRDLSEAHFEVGFCVRNLRHPDCTIRDAGDMYDSLSEARRATGLLELLLNADEAAFATQLAHSGYARRNYLARCAKASFFDYHACASNSEALFDALAAGQLAIARDIGALSPAAFRPNEEYEEDFWYAHFLHVYLGSSAPSRGAVLDRFAGALDGDASPRLEICRAFVARDQLAFDEALEELLAQRDEVVDELRLGRAQEEVAAAVQAYVFVEGLALLCLAERAGFRLKAEYRYCPALARIAAGHSPPVDELPPA